MKMEIEHERIRIRTGHMVHRHTYRPVTPPLGGVVMIHGLGEHLGRYEHVAEFFCRHGLMCTGMDLPGHGRSSGRRGHIPGLRFLTELLDQDAARLRQVLGPDLPLGLFAHSMGGFVALEYLPRRTSEYQFAWLSSPLIRPSANMHPVLVQLARVFGRLVPWLPFRTGVSAKACRLPDPKTGETKLPDPLMHGRVSAGFGTELILKEEELLRQATELSPDLHFFLTHGTEDRVCPPHFSRALYDLLPLKKKRYVEVPGSLHEPIHDDRDWVFERAAAWLNEMGFAAGTTPTAGTAAS